MGVVDGGPGERFPDPVREERIALLELHTTQMQAYKIYAFSLLAGFFAVVQWLSGLGWKGWASTVVIWVVVGVVAGGLFFCLGRFMWYGAMLSKTVVTPFRMDAGLPHPPMALLESRIGESAMADARVKTEKKLKRLERWLIRLGKERLELFCWSIAILDIVLIIGLVVTTISVVGRL